MPSLPSRNPWRRFRGIVGSDPETYTPDLAMSLHNLAGHLHRVRRDEDALAVAQEAADTYRTLDGARAGSFAAELAGALGNVATLLDSSAGPQTQFWRGPRPLIFIGVWCRAARRVRPGTRLGVARPVDTIDHPGQGRRGSCGCGGGRRSTPQAAAVSPAMFRSRGLRRPPRHISSIGGVEPTRRRPRGISRVWGHPSQPL